MYARQGAQMGANMNYNIAIDGPAGAGKSTVARMVAKKLHFIYVDTGAMYRAIALFFLQKGIDPQDTETMAAQCRNAEVSITYEDGEQIVLLNGENVNRLIRTEEVSTMSSKASAVPEVRARLLDLQRGLAAGESVVMDGRDIGTCVLPQADVKIFLTASTRVRALRRHEELQGRGIAESLESVERKIIERDEADRNRAISPLREAEDAVHVDTSDMTVEEAVDRVLEICREKMA